MNVNDWIDMVVEEAINEARKDPGFDVDGYIMETVDGSHWVIYRGHAVEYANEFPNVWDRNLDFGADSPSEALIRAVYEDLSERVSAEVHKRLLAK